MRTITNYSGNEILTQLQQALEQFEAARKSYREIELLLRHMTDLPIEGWVDRLEGARNSSVCNQVVGLRRTVVLEYALYKMRLASIRRIEINAHELLGRAIKNALALIKTSELSNASDRDTEVLNETLCCTVNFAIDTLFSDRLSKESLHQRECARPGNIDDREFNNALIEAVREMHNSTDDYQGTAGDLLAASLVYSTAPVDDFSSYFETKQFSEVEHRRRGRQSERSFYGHASEYSSRVYAGNGRYVSGADRGQSMRHYSPPSSFSVPYYELDVALISNCGEDNASIPLYRKMFALVPVLRAAERDLLELNQEMKRSTFSEKSYAMNLLDSLAQAFKSDVLDNEQEQKRVAYEYQRVSLAAQVRLVERVRAQVGDCLKTILKSFVSGGQCEPVKQNLTTRDGETLDLYCMMVLNSLDADRALRSSGRSIIESKELLRDEKTAGRGKIATLKNVEAKRSWLQ
jgi:hypothetical protein